MVLLHGFDGSCIGKLLPTCPAAKLPCKPSPQMWDRFLSCARDAEYRRMKPCLDLHVETWAVDLLGNGFCSSGLEGRPNAELGPAQRRQHLYAFWKQEVLGSLTPPCLVKQGGEARESSRCVSPADQEACDNGGDEPWRRSCR